MMNVLTDILYDSSSLMSSQNFKETLSQNKILSSQDITFEEEQMHQMSVSQIHNIDQTILSTNHSGMDFYNSSNQIHLSSNINAGFEGENDVSVFSDSFPEIVPSWLTHDFMKASDSLPSPDILSNVSDIYPSTTETEHLEMLDLGFPTELTSQDVASARLGETCISESQKLLAELPIQRFSNNDPLLMTSFNDVNMTDLNSMQYQKFKQGTHPMSSHASLMAPILPCESNLLHLPLHSSLTDQCLTTTSSPMMSNSQSQSHPVGVACDKLPQINLNHLNSFLGGKTTLSNIQLLHQDFPNVGISSEINCNQPSQSENCHPILHNTTHELLSTNMTLTRDASIQVSENIPSDNLPQSPGCHLCSKVTSGSAIEVVQCFKCKFCDYISLHKCEVDSHINSTHSKSLNVMSSIGNEIADNKPSPSSSAGDASGIPNASESDTISVTLPTFNTIENNIIIPAEGSLIQNENSFEYRIYDKLLDNASAYKLHLLSNHNINHDPEKKNFSSHASKFECGKCNKLFSDSSSYTSHMMSDHNVRLEPVHVSALNGFLNYNANHINVAPINNQQRILLKVVSQNAKSLNGKQKLLPKETNNNAEDPVSKVIKTVSSHKKAWQKKMKRELGSYICEFKGCNIRFRALDNLEYHKKCHVSGGSSFACPECGMTFENWGTIAGHLWRIHKNDMELHACDQCPFRHYSISHLEQTHKKIHLDECSFLCDKCGKGFKNGKQMRNHRDRCHYNPKKKRNSPPAPLEPKCKICSTHFASRVLLQHHEDTVHNMKRKSFMCNYCDYISRKKSTLDMHMRQHTGEKPFECDQCDYRTADHNSLRRHKMIHSGEKPYRCPFCPYSAIQASSYKEHMKRHPGHNGVMFSCEICSFKTVKRDKYILHVNDHESINMLQNASSMSEMNSTEEIYPMAEAMDISLSYGDNNFIPHLNKNMQSFFNCLGVNMVSFGQESAT